MLLYISVKRNNMKEYSRHLQPRETTVEDFIQSDEVVQLIKTATHFGDKVRLMQEQLDLNTPDTFLQQLV